MDRRTAMMAMAGAGLGGPVLAQPRAAGQARDAARRGLPPVKITDVQVILTEVAGNRLTNVKVLTSEPGLYGIGCGTHVERPLVVATTIRDYLRPFLIGRNADEIEKIWQQLWVAPYWRASVDANNAMAAVDAALWDIMGKRAGMPVHDLLGGKVRDGLRVMADVRASSPQALEDDIRKHMADGYQHFRVYLGKAGGGTLAGTLGPQQSQIQEDRHPSGDLHGNDAAYINELCLAFEHIRKTIGFDIEIGHDVHERPTPQGALMLAKAVEPYRPFFIEDLFAPEDSG
jgi:mannonate dehydratase